MDIIQQFEKLWGDFIASFKGRLLAQSEKQEISFPLAKLILQETVLCWSSDFTTNSKWLNELLKDQPQKGRLVKEILINDLKLSEVTAEKRNPNLTKIAVPFGSALAGFALAKILKWGLIGTAGLTLIPAAVSLPIVNSYLQEMKHISSEEIINKYVSQLDKYKASIISVLLSDVE